MRLAITPRRVRLAVQELNARTLPAVMFGFETPLIANVTILACEETHTDDASDMAITSLVDDESTLLFESNMIPYAELKGEGESGDVGEEFLGATDSELFERPIMPYYRSLNDTGEDAELIDVTPEVIDPNWKAMTTFGVEGSEVIEGEWATLTLESEPKLEDVVLWPEEMADGSELIYYTMDDIADSNIVALETPVEVTEVIDEIAMLDAATGGEVAGPVVAEDQLIDPAVCFAPLHDDVLVMNTAVVDELNDEAEEALLSAFTLDDFLVSETFEDTQELDLTAEIVVAEVDARSNEQVPTPEATVEEKPASVTDYFSIDGDMLDRYFGMGSKKRK